jgi:putative restriction endonuclease
MSSLLKNILSLNRAPTHYGKAPHKPVLLLAVIESYENGEISGNQIPVSENLLHRFHDIWNLLVTTENVLTFSLPFYHLKNEKGNFWNLVTFPGRKIPTTKSKSIKSYKALRETVVAAELSPEFYYYLTDPVERKQLNLPQNKNFHPSAKSLHNHRNRFGF